ncbi:hypothetical protein BKA70DRAFT_1233811 [Coprinopsis sp. MPI-PUGE-AT-0042]|nr:hypothetical protein BKA70DRAFT_1233811 [Coprinopsis sp. MPI-PUGE-AT-0042]
MRPLPTSHRRWVILLAQGRVLTCAGSTSQVTNNMTTAAVILVCILNMLVAACQGSVCGFQDVGEMLLFVVPLSTDHSVEILGWFECSSNSYMQLLFRLVVYHCLLHKICLNYLNIIRDTTVDLGRFGSLAKSLKLRNVTACTIQGHSFVQVLERLAKLHKTPKLVDCEVYVNTNKRSRA